jgi:hypothetical protein
MGFGGACGRQEVITRNFVGGNDKKFIYSHVFFTRMAERPLGVTILGILWLIGGIVLLAMGASAAFLGGMLMGAVGAAFGGAFVILGIVEIAIGIGCFKGWGWVWTVAVIIAIINLLTGIYALVTTGFSALLSLIITIIILYYLFQPNVKAFFGKA